MAAAPLRSLLEEATCAICLQYFQEPVLTGCGHSFCHACIGQCWSRAGAELSCPHCRQRCLPGDLRPNRQLASVADIAKQLEEPAARARGETPRCPEHDEQLKLFCRSDERAVCLVCARAREHRAHTLVPIKEAARDYEKRIQHHLDTLKRQLEDILEFKLSEEKKVEELKEETVNQRQKIVSEFEEMQQLLNEKKLLLLTGLEDQERGIQRKIMGNVTLLEEQRVSLQTLIGDMEGSLRKPSCELLKVAGLLFQRCKHVKFQRPAPVPPALTTYFLSSASQQLSILKEIFVKIKGTVSEEIGTLCEESEWIMAQRSAVTVTLDPKTAHPDLTLYRDRRTVKYGQTRKELPDNPEWFTYYPFVLGCEKFSSGRWYWEVQVGDKTAWELGVCKESVSRKEWDCTVAPETGYWVVCLRNQDKYWARTSPVTHLTPRLKPRTIGIFLDYDVGKISFYNVEGRSHLFTFTDTFTDTLRPYFYPCNNQGRNRGSLTIQPVRGRDQGIAN